MEPLENENLKVGNTGKTPKEDEEDIEIAEKDSVKTLSLEPPKQAEKIETLAQIDKEIIDEKKEIESRANKNDSTKTAKTLTVAVKEKESKNDQNKKDSLKLALEKNIEVKNDKPVKPVPTQTVAQKEKDTKPVPTLTVDMKEKEVKHEKPIPTPSVAVKEKEVKTEKPSEIKSGTDQIEFKVQFAGSEKELDLKQEKYAAIENGWYYKVGTTLKYTSGNYKQSADAFKHQAKLREAGFKDCFVVAFKNGARIDINEAIKQTKTP